LRRKLENRYVGPYADWAVYAMKKIRLNGPRRIAPSNVEIEAIRAHQPIICRFYFLDGRAKAIGIEPSWIAQDVIKEVADKIGLKSTEGRFVGSLARFPVTTGVALRAKGGYLPSPAVSTAVSTAVYPTNEWVERTLVFVSAQPRDRTSAAARQPAWPVSVGASRCQPVLVETYSAHHRKLTLLLFVRDRTMWI
jgi:hypothetical protein